MNDTSPACIIPGCEAAIYALSLCDRHYNKQRALRRHAGEFERVDAAAARAHIAALRRRGWAWQVIGQAAGTSHMMLRRIVDDATATMPRHKLNRLLAVEPVWQCTTVPVPAVGTIRRLSALTWQGWPHTVIANELGLSVFTFRNINRDGNVEARTAAAVDDFYRANAYRPGPNPAYAKKARTLGAIPAAAWDDWQLDDPDARPHLDDVDRRTKVHLDDVDHFAGYGMDDQAIAEQLNVTLDTLRHARRRAENRGRREAA